MSIDRSVSYTEWKNRERSRTERSNWIYKTPGDIENELREAYQRNDRDWLQAQAWEFPLEYLTAADAIGVDMPQESRLWLQKHSPPPPPPEPAPRAPKPPKAKRLPAPQPPPPLPSPQERCRDCGDFLPVHRQIPWCVRCNKVRLQAAQEAREREMAQVVRQPLVYHCLACRTNIPDPGKGPRLCTKCFDDRYVEQPSEDDGVLVRNTGAIPHLAFYMNRCGESVVNGRILPHPRYGESRVDRFGDTLELDDD